MRVFTAIPLPQKTKDLFAEVSRGRLPVPYVNTELFHITLQFLGELDHDRQRLARQVWDELPDFHGFEVRFERLQVFNRQIHMTVAPNPALAGLESEMRRRFQDAGFRFRFPAYYPHVTITNLHMDKVMYPDRRVEKFPNAELARLGFTAERIVMFESKVLLHHHHHYPISERALL